MNLPNWFACASGMDVIPYEYYSHMRIRMPDGIREILGHWEYCPPGAKEIPFLHPYLCHFWDDERDGHDGQLGELPFVLGRWKGTRNTRYTGQCFIGSEAAWNGEKDYPPGFHLEVDEEGIPIGCCALEIGTDGKYFRKVFEGRHWSTLVRTGDRDDGTWRQERSWQAVSTTSAHYESVWFHRRAWNGVYETTDHFAGTWHHERSWDAVVTTTAHYAGAWDQERSGVGVYETLEHQASAWDQERSYGVVYTTSAVEVMDCDQERSWSAVVRTSASYAAAWDDERSYVAVYETLDHFAGACDQERSWQMVKRTSAHYAADWDQERSWQAFVTTPLSVAADWHREHQWSAVVITVDNVISFSCGTIVAAGSTQGTATAIANDTVSATSTGANQGLILPAACNRIIVWNANAPGGNSISVYPPSGAQIGSLGINNPATVNSGFGVMFVEITATLWRSFLLN